MMQVTSCALDDVTCIVQVTTSLSTIAVVLLLRQDMRTETTTLNHQQQHVAAFVVRYPHQVQPGLLLSRYSNACA